MIYRNWTVLGSVKGTRLCVGQSEEGRRMGRLGVGGGEKDKKPY